MAIELEMSSDRKLLQVLSGLNEENARKACIVAGKRAATAARAAGSRQIRSIYTMKAADVKAKARIKGTGDGAVIEIRSTTEPVEKYKAQKRTSGVFVAVKRGGMKKVERGFTIGTKFVARVGRERFPVKGLYGPSIPQLYGNPDVMKTMEERGSEVFDERLEHEIAFRLGKA